MKDSLKRIAAIFLSVAMAVTFMPILGMNPEKAYASDDQTTWYEGVKYVVNDDDGTATVEGRASEELSEDLVIPAYIELGNYEYRVTTISTGAFSSCSKLKTVKISNGIETIGNTAFLDCENLKEVIIPESVTSMGNAVFSSCTNLTSVYLKYANITTIGRSAFYHCSALDSITLPESVTTIESDAFEGCTSLRSLDFPENVETIETDAFYGCTSLWSITLLWNLKSIGASAFRNVHQSITIHYLGSEEQWDAISKENWTNLSNPDIHFIPEPTVIEKASPEKDGVLKYCCEDGYVYPKNYVISRPAAIKLSASSFTYNGSEMKPDVTVVDEDDYVIDASNYDVSYSNNVNVGTAAVNVAFKGEWYEGSMNATFTIVKETPAPAPVAKAANTLTLKGKTFKVNAKQLKKKAKKFSITKVVAVTGAQGAVTYAKASGNKKIIVSKTGKVTVKKKLKKGTYKVKVNVTAAGNDAYDPATKAVTFKVKVK